jgi:hypothetical protein
LQGRKKERKKGNEDSSVRLHGKTTQKITITLVTVLKTSIFTERKRYGGKF